MSRTIAPKKGKFDFRFLSPVWVQGIVWATRLLHIQFPNLEALKFPLFFFFFSVFEPVISFFYIQFIFHFFHLFILLVYLFVYLFIIVVFSKLQYDAQHTQCNGNATQNTK